MAESIRVNGEERPLQARMLADLVRQMGFDPDRPGLAAAVNGELIPRGRWSGQPLSPGDSVELVGATLTATFLATALLRPGTPAMAGAFIVGLTWTGVIQFVRVRLTQFLSGFLPEELTRGPGSARESQIPTVPPAAGDDD